LIEANLFDKKIFLSVSLSLSLSFFSHRLSSTALAWGPEEVPRRMPT